MAFGDSMVQGCLASDIGCIERTLVLQEKLDHWNRSDSGSSVNCILASFILDTGGRWGLIIQQPARNIKILFRSSKM
jgi:hypothetical protein